MTEQLERLDIYLNPAPGYLKMSGLLLDGVTASATLIDAAGRAVAVLGFGESRLDLTGLPTGMYMLRVEDREAVLTRQVVVE